MSVLGAVSAGATAGSCRARITGPSKRNTTSTQTVVMRRWEQRGRASVTRAPNRCQRSDTMGVPVSPCFAFSASATWRSSTSSTSSSNPASTSSRAKPARGSPCSSAPSTCSLGGRASADLVRTGEDTATVQAVFERADGREADRAARDLGAGPQPRVHRRCAGDGGRAQGHGRMVCVDLARSARTSDAARSGRTSGPSRRVSGSRRSRRRRGGSVRGVARGATPRSIARASTTARSARGSRWRRFSSTRSTRSRRPTGEDAQLEAERAVLANADRLARLSTEAYAALYDGDDAALVRLAGVWKRVADLAAIDARFTPYLSERDAIKSSLDDLAIFLRSYIADLDASPERLQAVEDRLAALERLKRKYGPALDDVLGGADELSGRAGRARRERGASRGARDRGARDARRVLRPRVACCRRERRRRPTAWRAQLESALAELAMPQLARARPRRVEPTGPRPGRDGASTRSSSCCHPTPARTFVRWRASRPAVSSRA